MILNGVNNETRIKVSGRQREWSFRNCTHTYVGHMSAEKALAYGLIDKIIDKR